MTASGAHLLPTRDAAVEPLVSIIIPCYNPGPFLQQAIESALGQSHPRIEVLVADDGSTEDVRALLQGYDGVRYVRQPNGGVASARNRGARESRGDFLVFLDSDDRLLPDAVKLNLERLLSRADAAFAAGLCYPIDSAGRSLPFQQEPVLTRDCYEEMLESNFIWMPAQVLYRRAAFEASGGFDPTVDACADYDIYLRIIRAHPVVIHRELVSEYRFHGSNMSGNRALMLASALQVLDRQRPFLRGNPAYRRAYRKGRRFWQRYYGGPLVEDIRTGIRSKRTRMRALRDGLVLLRHWPVEALRQLGRKIRRLLLTPSRDG